MARLEQFQILGKVGPENPTTVSPDGVHRLDGVGVLRDQLQPLGRHDDMRREERGLLHHQQRGGGWAEEAINTPFCTLQEIFHTFVLRGLRNISEAP